jgi:hypothetical protein
MLNHFFLADVKLRVVHNVLEFVADLLSLVGKDVLFQLVRIDRGAGENQYATDMQDAVVKYLR